MKKKSAVIAIVAFLVICIAAVAIYVSTRQQPQEGTKSVTIEVVYPDGEHKNFDIKTDAEFLSDALVEAGLVSEEEKAFFSTVDGVTADWSENQSWWCITKDGEECMSGAAELALADGDHYEITYTIGM